MEKMDIKEGRFIPSAGQGTVEERLLAVELFLMRFSQEMEYAMCQLTEALGHSSLTAIPDEEVTL